MKQYIVDAFTNEPFSGNPAAVCVMDQWPSEKSMMKLAMENNLSETAFIVKEEKAGTKMKRVFGFALFFVALGMVIMMFIPSIFIGILIVLLCLLVGYQLFCC